MYLQVKRTKGIRTPSLKNLIVKLGKIFGGNRGRIWENVIKTGKRIFSTALSNILGNFTYLAMICAMIF